MTENPQDPPTPPEDGGDESGQEKRRGPVNAPATQGEPVGFKVYDKTLKRFVGPLAESKSAAEKALNKVKGHKYETREV